MNMTMQQLKTYITGVLKGWLKNKDTIDKFSTASDGTLQWGGEAVKSSGQTVIGRRRETIFCNDTYFLMTKSYTWTEFYGLLKPITEFDEIVITMFDSVGHRYVTPAWQVSDIVDAVRANQDTPRPNSASIMIFTPDGSVMQIAYSHNFPPDGMIYEWKLDFGSSSKGVGIYKIEGIKYIQIPADGDVLQAVTQTLDTLNEKGE